MGPLGAYGWKAVDAILAAHNPDRVRWQVIGALVDCGSDYHSPIPVQVHHGAVFARNDAGDCVEVQAPEDGLLVVESEDRSSLEAFSYRVE